MTAASTASNTCGSWADAAVSRRAVLCPDRLKRDALRADAASGMKLDFLGWIERFVATPSVSRDGNRAISDLAAELLGEVGLEPRFSGPADCPDQRNVIADAGPEDEVDGGLLLLTHLDTVPPGDPELWTATDGDPFRPTRTGDRLYGLGSADAKTDLVCKAAALAEIDFSRLRRRLRIVGTFGEEIGLLGTRHLVDGGETRGFAAALVGEPSEGVAIVAHKGYAVFEARLPRCACPEPPDGARIDRVREVYDGVSAHSSTPALGQNALESALERIAASEVVGVCGIEGGGAVNQVPDRCTLDLWLGPRASAGAGYPPAPLVEFHRAWRAFAASLRAASDPRFDPGHTVTSLGSVHFADGQPVFRFDVRPIPGADPEQLVRVLEDVCEVACVRRNPPLATDENSPLVAAVTRAQRACGMEPAIGTKATCTEAGLLSVHGLDAVVIGAGTSVGNVHRPNEHTRISELERMRALYARAIETLLCAEGA